MEIFWAMSITFLGAVEVSIHIVARFLFSFLYALDDIIRLSLTGRALLASLCLVNIDLIISFLS
jgi:hypothetical protein